MVLPKDYNKQEITLHRASQLISLTGVNLIEPLPDDSHTTLVWDSDINMLIGRSFVLNASYYRIGIKLETFELVLLDKNIKTVQSIYIGGVEESELVKVWEDWLKNLGYEGKPITKVHYELPKNKLYQLSKPGTLTPEFTKAWAWAHTLANNVMQKLNEQVGIASEINIWPHHFDTGVYYPVTIEEEETTQSIGAGMAMADTMLNEPYFYIYGWTKYGAIDFEKAPALTFGTWLTDGWQGAVLKLSTVPEQNAELRVNRFMNEALVFLQNELSKNAKK